jgi:hypothetical protein
VTGSTGLHCVKSHNTTLQTFNSTANDLDFFMITLQMAVTVVRDLQAITVCYFIPKIYL